MKIKFIYKLLISVIFGFFLQGVWSLPGGAVQAETYVSISPAMTEIIYALNAENKLLAVSTACKYPKEAQNKEKIGNSFFINDEKILKLRPDYILALDTSEFMLNKFKRFNIKPLCFKYPDIESVYKNISTLGKLTGQEKRADEIIKLSKKRIEFARYANKTPKKILYLVETMPLITIGKNSFITDIIEKSGHISVTSNINSYYPVILEEYAIKQRPDVIVLSHYCDDERIKKFFPNAKVLQLSKDENDIINRPGPRVYEAVEFFSRL